MTDAERDYRLTNLERTVDEIKKEQLTAREREQSIQLGAATMNGEIANLLKALGNHERWHKDHDEKKWKFTDVILACGMLAITIMQFVGVGAK